MTAACSINNSFQERSAKIFTNCSSTFFFFMLRLQTWVFISSGNHKTKVKLYLSCDTSVGKLFCRSGSENTRFSNRCLLCNSHVTWNFFKCSFSYNNKTTRNKPGLRKKAKFCTRQKIFKVWFPTGYMNQIRFYAVLIPKPSELKQFLTT